MLRVADRRNPEKSKHLGTCIFGDAQITIFDNMLRVPGGSAPGAVYWGPLRPRLGADSIGRKKTKAI